MERYRLQQSEQRSGGPTELYSQLRTVAGDDLPARRCSEFVCKSRNRSIITAAKQKERFQNSRKTLLRNYTEFLLLLCSLAARKERKGRWNLRLGVRVPAIPISDQSFLHSTGNKRLVSRYDISVIQSKPWTTPSSLTLSSFHTHLANA